MSFCVSKRAFLFIIVATVAGGVLLSRAQSVRAQEGSPCAKWMFYQEKIESTRYDGYLLCESTGELWTVNGDEKKLVTVAKK